MTPADEWETTTSPDRLIELMGSWGQQFWLRAGSLAAGTAPADAPAGHPWHATFQIAYFAAQTPTVEFIRCLFANPFRPPPAFDPRWRTSTAVALARQAQDAHAFDRLPILADALEEAGCDDADLLAHCRGPGPHARGCRAVGLVLAAGGR